MSSSVQNQPPLIPSWEDIIGIIEMVERNQTSSQKDYPFSETDIFAGATSIPLLGFGGYSLLRAYHTAANRMFSFPNGKTMSMREVYKKAGLSPNPGHWLKTSVAYDLIVAKIFTDKILINAIYDYCDEKYGAEPPPIWIGVLSTFSSPDFGVFDALLRKDL